MGIHMTHIGTKTESLFTYPALKESWKEEIALSSKYYSPLC